MYFPSQSQLLIDETENFNNLNENTKSDGKMGEPSSYRFGVFCLTWKQGGENCSIWSFGIGTLLKLFFKLNKDQDLLYFPPEGKMIKVFKRLK